MSYLLSKALKYNSELISGLADQCKTIRYYVISKGNLSLMRIGTGKTVCGYWSCGYWSSELNISVNLLPGKQDEDF